MKHNINGKKAYSNDALLEYLIANIEEGSSVLDLGCGPKLYSMPFKNRGDKVLTVDAWDKVEPDMVIDLENDDITKIITDKYDYILMLDFIEHLDKEAGLTLIDRCKSIANKKIFLLTPMEEIWDENHKNVNDEKLWCYGNTFDLHKSLWTREDFKDWNEIKLKSLDDYFVGYYEI
jgi:2-polyprenyl-3-methyl-5-hydroxy-6-metoxy-1,4-benzoquinol methylase